MTSSDHNLARLAERSFEMRGDYPALLFEDQWHTSGELFERASRIATGLADLGVQPGRPCRRVDGELPGGRDHLQRDWRAGAIVTPAMFLLPADALAHIISDSEATAVITTPEFVDKVREAVQGIDSVRFVASTGEAAEGIVALSSLESSAAGSIVPRANDDLAALLYTGGTTGRSKGVMLTHGSLYYTGHAAHESAHVPGVNRALGTLPLSHAYGILITLAGMHNPEPGIAVLLRWFDPQAFLTLIPEHQLQIAAVVPSILQILLTLPLEEHDLSTLQWVSSGGAPLPPEVEAEFCRRVPSVSIRQGYGLHRDGRPHLHEPRGVRASGLGRATGSGLHRGDRR